MSWCNFYGGFLFSLGAALLIVASTAAVIEAFMATKARLEAARQARSGAQAPAALAAAGVDPVKFLEALKGLLQALKDLPTWIALFGAGLALVFLAGQEPTACSADKGNGSGNRTSAPNSIDANATKAG